MAITEAAAIREQLRRTLAEHLGDGYAFSVGNYLELIVAAIRES